jgi:hypothetical protein
LITLPTDELNGADVEVLHRCRSNFLTPTHQKVDLALIAHVVGQSGPDFTAPQHGRGTDPPKLRFRGKLVAVSVLGAAPTLCVQINKQNCIRTGEDNWIAPTSPSRSNVEQGTKVPPAHFLAD